MSSDSTYDDFAFADVIPESERDRHERELKQLGHKLVDPLKEHFDNLPPMSDAERAEFWEQTARARHPFNAVMDSSRPPGESPPFITVDHALAEMTELAKRPLITTPFPTLNSALTHGYDGIVSGQAYNVISQTGRGKTSLVNQTARHMASKGEHVIIAFYEAFAGYCISRMAAGPIGVSSNEIMRALDDDGKALKHAANVRKVVPEGIHLLNRPGLDVISRSADWLAQKHGKPPVVIIDYAQKLADQIMAGQKRPDARLAMSEASSALLELADETKATVIAVQSMSRVNGKRATDVRNLAPFELVDVAKESGAVEYDAAGMIVLTLCDDYEGDERVGTMTVAKARFGIECHVEMRFDGKSGLWRDLGRIEREPKDDIRDAVRVALATASKLDMVPGGPTALAEKVRKNRKETLAAIKEMLLSGEIVRTERGLELES